MKISRAIIVVVIHVVFFAGMVHAQEEGESTNTQEALKSEQGGSAQAQEPMTMEQGQSAQAQEPKTTEQGQSAQAQEPKTMQQVESVKAQEPMGSEVSQSAQTQEPLKDEEAQNSETQELLKKIEELEGKLDRLTEESSARKKLEITEEEKEQKEKDILEAVSDEYTLESRHTLSLDYTLTYSYAPAAAVNRSPYVTAVEDRSQHTLKHSISAGYGLRDNMSVSTSIPVLYRYYKMGTDQQIDQVDIGDLSLGLGYQPFKTKAGELRSTYSFSVSLPTGRSPYEINSDTELSSGSGTYGFSFSGSFSKEIDPVVAFWNVSYSYRLPVSGLDRHVSDTTILEKVEPGDTFGFGLGIAYAMSYKVSVNSAFNYSYSRTSIYTYNSQEMKPGDSVEATIAFGVGWRVNEKTTLSYSLGYGLSGSGFSLSFRIPFTFVM